MNKKEKLLIIFILLVGIYFIAKTIYNKSYQNCEQEQLIVIDSLNKEITTLKMKNEIILEDLNLMFDYYCSAENLLDTIFINFIVNGIFVFEYEPYAQASNKIFEYEELYNLLEERKKL